MIEATGRYLSVLRGVLGGEDEQRAACDAVVQVMHALSLNHLP